MHSGNESGDASGRAARVAGGEPAGPPEDGTYFALGNGAVRSLLE